MLVDRQEQYSVVRVSSGSRFRNRLLSRSTGQSVVIFLLFLAAVFVLQLASGAYKAEFSGYPDEPAHYITSLMVHDYIVGLHWSHPLEFAEQYYAHYPKVAFGHWPPFFYIVQAAWMLLFSTSRSSIRIEIALTSAFLAWSVYVQSKKWFGGRAGPILAGLVTISIPVVQTYMDEEMAEILLTVLCFWAAVYFAEFLDTERWRDAILFAVFFSLAVLTKGNGWLLAGLVPFGVALTRKFGVLLQRQFWVSVLIVAAVCLPWQILTLHMAEQGWTNGDKPSLGYTLTALVQFGVILLRIAGYPLGVLAVLGVIIAVIVPMARGPVRSSPAVMFALIVCTWTFHALVPAGVEDRKMVIAVPALVLFVFSGGYWLAAQLRTVSLIGPLRTEAVAIAGALLFAFTGFAVPRQTHYGFDDVARFITSQPTFLQKKILVSDDYVGEGLLISEVAMHERRPGNTIVRATKALAEMNWNGSHYRCLFSSADQVAAALQADHVDLVVIGVFVGFNPYRHNQLLRQALQDTNRFELLRTFQAASWKGRGEVMVYRVRRNFNPDATLVGTAGRAPNPIPAGFSVVSLRK
jgi:hypothetical protein